MGFDQQLSPLSREPRPADLKPNDITDLDLQISSLWDRVAAAVWYLSLSVRALGVEPDTGAGPGRRAGLWAGAGIEADAEAKAVMAAALSGQVADWGGHEALMHQGWPSGGVAETAANHQGRASMSGRHAAGGRGGGSGAVAQAGEEAEWVVEKRLAMKGASPTNGSRPIATRVLHF
jgi:hypothetical protein